MGMATVISDTCCMVYTSGKRSLRSNRFGCCRLPFNPVKREAANSLRCFIAKNIRSMRKLAVATIAGDQLKASTVETTKFSVKHLSLSVVVSEGNNIVLKTNP